MEMDSDMPNGPVILFLRAVFFYLYFSMKYKNLNWALEGRMETIFFVHGLYFYN